MIYDVWHVMYDIRRVICDAWHVMIHDVWQVVYDIRHLICDAWHVTYALHITFDDLGHAMYDIE